VRPPIPHLVPAHTQLAPCRRAWCPREIGPGPPDCRLCAAALRKCAGPGGWLGGREPIGRCMPRASCGAGETRGATS